MKTLLALLVSMLLVLAGCSAAPSADSTAGPGSPSSVEYQEGGLDAADLDSAAGETAAGDAGEAESGGDAAGGAADDPAGVGGVGGTAGDGGGAMMVRRATLEVVVDDVVSATTTVRATVLGAGGWIESEEIRPATETRPGSGSLVLRVPSEHLDEVLTDLGGLGEVTSSRSSATNVSAEYRDTEARIATLEAGADRLRELVGQAESVQDIADLERELSQREADLDGLKARLKALGEDVARSAVTLHLAEEADELPVEEEPTEGFLVGLSNGWSAFTSSVTVLVTALGALLPFLVLAALVVAPVVWWRRRSRNTVETRAGLGSSSDRHEAAAGDPDGS
ncbi:DUF4349 domain-containing protein [Ornithinimicrobium sp. Y1694]|uniref:DUF4349 domain-containing protein n=1 Tax=Ornithinimicrobium sp. Y1694 TaxID=3418590 RepID=UPI003CE867E2